MTFPTSFSFDGESMSFVKISNFTWSAKVKIREYNSTLTLYGNPQEPFTTDTQIGPKTIPLCKSNLQKCVRRKDINRAVRTAFAIYSQNPNEVLRRICIIMIEDCLILPSSFIKLVWWMAAVSKGYIMSKDEVENMLGIVSLMCESDTYDISIDADKQELDYTKLSTLQRDFLWALELRKIYGGMECDKRMIDYHIDLWYARFTGNASASCQQEEYSIDLDSVDKLSKDDILLEAIDHHPYPFLLSKISTRTGISKDSVKAAIWCCRSRINYRKPIDEKNFDDVNEKVKEVYEIIKDDVTGFTTWLRCQLNLKQ